MNNDETSTLEQETIHLATFIARKTEAGVLIKSIGKFSLKLKSDADSYTKGTITIADNKLPIMSNSQMSRQPQKPIDNNSCILLLGADSSFTTFKLGVLVDDVSEIQQIAYNEV